MSKDLIVEINDDSFVFIVGEYDESLNFKILSKLKKKASGIHDGKVIDLEKSYTIIKKCLDDLEEELSFVFKNVNLIINFNDYECINVTGFKRLNGDQLLKDDIFFILNNLKRQISENENNKSILHLFNTRYSLDGNEYANLPIGLSGNFYNHQISFLLSKNKHLENIRLLMNKCNLVIERINIKNFLEGINIINKEKEETFFKIYIGKSKSYILSFYKSSLCFYQNFNFGSDIVKSDISKVCTLKLSTVENFFSVLNFMKKDNLDQEYLDKKFFIDDKFRKVSLELIRDVSRARIEEIVSIIFSKNINLENTKNEINKIFLFFRDRNLNKNIEKLFEDCLIKSNQELKLKTNNLTQNDDFQECIVSAELNKKGWTKEALPVIQSEKSFISRIFSRFFE